MKKNFDKAQQGVFCNSPVSNLSIHPAKARTHLAMGMDMLTGWPKSATCLLLAVLCGTSNSRSWHCCCPASGCCC